MNGHQLSIMSDVGGWVSLFIIKLEIRDGEFTRDSPPFDPEVKGDDSKPSPYSPVALLARSLADLCSGLFKRLLSSSVMYCFHESSTWTEVFSVGTYRHQRFWFCHVSFQDFLVGFPFHASPFWPSPST